jgi:RimJ/RimL family protein N-acetyltransferase
LEGNLKNKSNFGLGIISRDTNQLIGEAGISKLDWVNRSGEYYIFVGDRSYWNRGVGTEVTRLVTNYGFAELNLNRIMLTVSSENVAGEKAYKKAGFKQEGIMREASFRQARFHDKILMSILRSEWAQSGLSDR